MEWARWRAHHSPTSERPRVVTRREARGGMGPHYKQGAGIRLFPPEER